MSQPPRFLPDTLDEIARLTQQHFLCRVVGLPEFVRKRFHEMNALPRQNNGRAFFDRHCNHRGPPGVHAKPNASLFHKILRSKRSLKSEPRTRSPRRLLPQSPAWNGKLNLRVERNIHTFVRVVIKVELEAEFGGANADSHGVAT
jgi:hypothetical protein